MDYRINGRILNVNNVINQSRRTISIKIVYPNDIEVISPYPMKEDDIISVLDRHKRFIVKRFENSEMDNDAIHILGKKYRLLIYESDFNNILVYESIDAVKIYSKSLKDEDIALIINKYYQIVLSNIVSKNIDYIKYKLKINFDIKFIYKRVNTYFGECYPTRKEVILNLKLAKYELKYILSVIYHELAHFHYQNHQQGFYRILEEAFPNYKITQSNLRKIKYNEKY